MTSIVYELRFADGTRYIGSASNWGARLKQHRVACSVFAGSVTFTPAIIGEHPTRREALDQERDTIRAARAAGEKIRNGDSAAHWRGVPKSAVTRARIGAANRGKTRGRRKVDRSDAIRMQIMRNVSGWTQVELAAAFGVCRATVRRCLEVTV